MYIKDRYAKLFPSKTRMPAKPLRTALGSLIIQKQYEIHRSVSFRGKAKSPTEFGAKLDMSFDENGMARI